MNKSDLESIKKGSRQPMLQQVKPHPSPSHHPPLTNPILTSPLFPYFIPPLCPERGPGGRVFISRCKDTTPPLRFTNKRSIFFSKNILTAERQPLITKSGHLVIWSKSFSKCQNRHYNIKFILYYSEPNDQSKIDFDQMTMTVFDHQHLPPISLSLTYHLTPT